MDRYTPKSIEMIYSNCNYFKYQEERWGDRYNMQHMSWARNKLRTLQWFGAHLNPQATLTQLVFNQNPTLYLVPDSW